MEKITINYDRGDHLNIDGARKVTNFIAKYLTDNYQLPDHRRDEGWQEWNELAGQYFEELQKKI